MSLRDRFEAFVSNQPRGEVINHSTWGTCAIGEFTRDYNTTAARNISTEDVVNMLAVAYGFIDRSFLMTPTSSVPTIMDVLCMGGRELMYNLPGEWVKTTRVAIVTYGDLQDALAGKLPIYVDYRELLATV